MTGYEAKKCVQPQDNIGYCKQPGKTATSYFWVIAVMFLLVVLLCSNSYALLNSYESIKAELSDAINLINANKHMMQIMAENEKELQKKYQMLTKEYNQLNEHYNKTSRGSESLYKQLEMLENQNKSLARQLKELTDDNIALQNSLKMAASAGIKPQNYTNFEGLQSRNSINRGKYIGKFLGTAYTPSKEECGNDKGITKSGEPVIPGISIAIDNSYWPFGTVFYIRGLGYTVAMDTGSAIKGKYRFDFSVFDKQFAQQLGSRKWDVYLVKLGTGNARNIEL